MGTNEGLPEFAVLSRLAASPLRWLRDIQLCDKIREILMYGVEKEDAMRNIPAFTCDFGAATLILQEIPIRGEACCVIQWAEAGKLPRLLGECAKFCRMAGASRVLATGLPEDYEIPPVFRTLRMMGSTGAIPETEGALWPLLPENGAVFRSVYNHGMAHLPTAMTLSDQDVPRLLEQGGCYFVHRGETLLGIGQVEKNILRSIVSCVPGAGRDVAAALLSTVQEETVRLQVLDSNHRAIALYEKLGFLTVGVGACWWELG